VGTFLAGFYLIATMGTIAIIWSIGAALLLMAILYWYRLWVLYVWAVIFAALMNMGMAPPGWASIAASSLALRAKPDPTILYEDESQYSYITVRRTSDIVDKRAFMEDKLTHSIIIMGDILNLQYPYEQIYAAVTHLAGRSQNKISVLAIGGGGYVFPRYIEKVWPGSHIDVAEIDHRVTEAAIRAFGLDRNTSINTFTMDARNYVDELLEKKRAGGQIARYDFIYEDAISDYSVPYQLTTREFNDKIAQLLTADGVYMVNLIDTYYIGLFLGAIVRTLEQTFPYVYVVTEERVYQEPWGTFVVVASMREISLENLASEKPVANLHLWVLNDAEMEPFIKKGREIVLTDDYAPVENLLAPVVRQSAIGSLPDRYMEWAAEREDQGKLDESLALYKEIIKLAPARTITAYNHIGQILAKQGKWQEAIDSAKSAIEYNEKAKIKHTMADMYFNISLASKKLGRDEDTSEYIRKAIEAYQKDLAQEPNSIKTLRNLGNALVEAGRFSEATKYLKRAIDMGPSEVANHLSLATALSMQQRYDEAIEVIKKAIVSFSNIRSENSIRAVHALQKRLWDIEDSKNSK
jgi:spermidine synthase/Tfp pilus assembly protein PilF